MADENSMRQFVEGWETASPGKQCEVRLKDADMSRWRLSRESTTLYMAGYFERIIFTLVGWAGMNGEKERLGLKKLSAERAVFFVLRDG